MLRGVGLFIACVTWLGSAAAQTAIPTGSRLEAIVNSKLVRIAYRADATPFAFVRNANEPIGYSIDLCRLVVKSIEQQFALPPIRIEWVPVTVQTRLSAVSDGNADMECGSTTVSLERMKDVDFSNVIFVESTGILVARAANIGAFPDLARKKVAVVAGTTNERAVMRYIHEQKLDIELVAVKDRDDGVAALEAGTAHAFASGKLLLAGARLKQPELLAMLPDDLSIEPYAIVLPRGDWALRLAVNAGLAQVYRSGLIVDVYNTWFGSLGLQPGVLMKAAFMLGALPD